MSDEIDKELNSLVDQLKQPVCSWADEVEETNRGDSGFGSSGK